MTSLKLLNLKKYFSGVIAVDDVTLEFSSGEMVGLIGPNGAGKTTLINLISGFLYPDKGQVLLDGREITRLPAFKRVRLGITKTFQTPIIIPELTVKEACSLPYLIYNHPTTLNYDPQFFESLLHATGLVYKQDLKLSQCPPTELRLVQLVYSVIREPKILLLDEPFVGLNVNQVTKFFGLVKNKVVQNEGIIIIIEHNLPVVTKLVERIIVMNAGKIIADGSPTEVMRMPEVIQTYFGSTKIKTR
jgi:branched-chain amino acid transport system ATP-binding protein